MYDLVTFGDMVLRMGAPQFKRIEQSDCFEVGVTGGEMNACVIASRCGLKTAHVTRLPQNALGRMIVNGIRMHGIDTSHIVWASPEERVGLMFLEFGAMPRTNAVLYDRKNCATANLKPGQIDWDPIFEQAKLFHFSGTAPALSPSLAEATKEAMICAKKHNVKVSMDVNYRSKLWTEQQAQETIVPLMEYCDILITTEEDAYKVFKIQGSDYRQVAQILYDTFKLDIVAITLRKNVTVLRNDWTAIAYADGKLYDDITYNLELIDRVGGGDAFTGGFLYAYRTFDGDIKKCLQYGNASSALKQTIPGDLNWSTLEEIEDLIERGKDGGMTLRVVR